MTLAELKKGEKAKVIEFQCNKTVLQRLNNMGLTVATEIEVIRYAPLGDPIEIRLRGFYMAIRKSLARQIMVVKIEKNYSIIR